MTPTDSHACVENVNKMLAESGSNTRLASAICFSNAERELIMLATVKADDAVRKKPSLFFASYCPMCGVKLRGAA